MTIYEFSNFCFDTSTQELRNDLEEIALRQKARDLLQLFLENADRIVTREEIQEQLWGELNVDPNSLSQLISELRRIFRDHEQDTLFIKTIPKVGYQWVFHPTVVHQPQERKLIDPGSQRLSRRWIFAITGMLLLLPLSFILSDLLQKSEHRQSDEIRLLLLPFNNLTNKSELDWLELGYMDMVARDLNNQHGVETIPVSDLMARWKKGDLRFNKRELDAERIALISNWFPHTFLVHTTIEFENNTVIFEFHTFENGKFLNKRRVTSTNPMEVAREVSQVLYSELKLQAEAVFGSTVYHDQGFINEAYAKGLQWAYYGEFQKALHYYDICLLHDPTWRMSRFSKASALLTLGRQAEALTIAQSLLNDISNANTGEADAYLESSIQKGTAHYLLADILVGMRNPKEAETHFQSALNCHLPPIQKARLHVLGGKLYTLLGDMEASLREYQNALVLYGKLGSVQGKAYTHLNLGQLYLRMNTQISKAEQHINKAVAYARTMDNRSIQAFGLVQLGGQLAYENPQKAKSYLETGLALKRDLGEERGIAIALDYLADTYMRLGEKHQESVAYLMEAYSIWSEVKDPYNLINNLLLQSQYNLLAKDYKQARLVLDEAQTVCREQQDWDGVILCFLGYWEVAFQQGNFEEIRALHTQIDELLPKVSPYMMYHVDCFRAAYFYKVNRVEDAITLLESVKEKMGPSDWKAMHQTYLDIYLRTGETGIYVQLPIENNPLDRPY
ncbi:MAG: hypothetical protein CR997_00055 [Acidobacteria bacterium]|nr:MAG: hypothetical protein CR997_00055 [Acidobacteriota bacterium]